MFVTITNSLASLLAFSFLCPLLVCLIWFGLSATLSVNKQSEGEFPFKASFSPYPCTENMGSKYTLTYMRRRLFSRRDQIGLHSDTPSAEVLESKVSANSDNYEKSCAEWGKKETEIGVSYDSAEDKVEENPLLCENCNSLNHVKCSEDPKRQRLNLDCAIGQDFSISISAARSSTVEHEQRSSELAVSKVISNRDIHLEESRVGSQNLSAVQSIDGENNAAEPLAFMKLGSECDDKWEDRHLVSLSSDVCSGEKANVSCLRTSDEINCNHDDKGASTLVELDWNESNYLHKTSSTTCKNVATTFKLNSSLITFRRRSKRKQDTTTPYILYETAGSLCSTEKSPLACSVELKNEKIANSLAGNEEKNPAPATAVIVDQDTPLHLADGTTDNCPPADTPSSEEMLPFQGKARINIEDNQHVNKLHLVSPSSSHENLDTSRIGISTAMDIDTLSSVCLSVSAPARHDIDCNQRLSCGFNETNLHICLEVPHGSSASNKNEIKEDMSPLLLQHQENTSPLKTACNKGKLPIDSCPVLPSDMAQYSFLQLFPENLNTVKVTVSMTSEDSWSHPKTTGVQPSYFRGFPLQQQQIFATDACYSSAYGRPDVQPQAREHIQDFPPLYIDRAHRSFSKQKMFDNTLTQSRPVTPNRSGLDKFSSPSLWLDEELDSLWIGVRRHGRGNFEAIWRDPRLHFLPWKRPHDLAEKWQEEQHKLLCSTPHYRANFLSPQELTKAHMNHLLVPREEKGSFLVSQPSVSATQRSKQLQYLVTNPGTLSSPHNMWNYDLDPFRWSEGNTVPWNGSSSQAAPVNESLPHWLRETAVTRGSLPVQAHATGSSLGHFGAWSPSQPNFYTSANPPQLWLNNQHNSAQKTEKPGTGGRGTLFSSPLVIQHMKTEPDERVVNKQDDSMIIPSDASSEETISDDHSSRPL